MHFSATFYATVLAAASAVHAIPVPEPLPNLAATIAARRVRTNNGINATVSGVQYTNARNGADAACARGYTAWCNLGGTTTPGTTAPGTTTPGTTTPGTTTPGTTTPGTTTPGTTTPGTTTPGTTTPGTTTPGDGTTTPGGGTTTPGGGTTTTPGGGATDSDGDGVPDIDDPAPNDPTISRRGLDSLD